jgi:hypothetical protein
MAWLLVEVSVASVLPTLEMRPRGDGIHRVDEIVFDPRRYKRERMPGLRKVPGEQLALGDDACAHLSKGSTGRRH